MIDEQLTCYLVIELFIAILVPTIVLFCHVIFLVVIP